MQVEVDGPALLIAFIAGFLLACVIAAFCIKPVLDAGARAHADGKVVVVDLPDGTRVVVKPKPKEAP